MDRSRPVSELYEAVRSAGRRRRAHFCAVWTAETGLQQDGEVSDLTKSLLGDPKRVQHTHEFLSGRPEPRMWGQGDDLLVFHVTPSLLIAMGFYGTVPDRTKWYEAALDVAGELAKLSASAAAAT